jgi:endonuclease YncB( thermonuclease family)
MKILKLLIFLLILNNFILIDYLTETQDSLEDFQIIKTNITRVIDGDTIETRAGRVRFLGLNTPEPSQPKYKEAREFLKKYENSEVELYSKEKDRYGRILAYVFSKNTNINLEIINSGLGHLYYYNKDEFYKKMEKAEKKARRKLRGIWTPSNHKCSDCIKLLELNEKDPGEYAIFQNVCNYECNLNITIKDEATNIFPINLKLKPSQKKKIDFKGRIWNDNGDTLFLYDNSGLILWFRY